MKKTVRSRALIGIVMMSLVVSAAVAQSAPPGQDTTQETQVRGFWIDPSTGLMWAAKDSGKDVSYKAAVNYCRDLRLAGYSDWRLATLGDMQGIYDKTANAPGLVGPQGKEQMLWHVKGNLFLTGLHWAYDLRGVRSNREYYFEFNAGRSEKESSGFWSAFHSMRALCVRDSAPQALEATTQTQTRGFWTDPSTKLMWAAKDSGKDETYESAVKYCRDLRLAGHSDWRLATLGELQSIYDKTANAPGLAGRYGEIRMLWHVKGNLLLTGYQWEYDQSAGGYHDFLEFNDGESINNWQGSSVFRRALCVRGSAPPGQEATQETQVRGFWTDPSTGLMWASKDNGKDVSYKGAVNYCRDLRLAGHSDWRLATMGELQGVYDKTANAPGLSGGKVRDTWHVKGNLFLTGYQWAYTQSGGGVFVNVDNVFDFNDGRSRNASMGFWSPSHFLRALCVRGSGK